MSRFEAAGKAAPMFRPMQIQCGRFVFRQHSTLDSVKSVDRPSASDLRRQRTIPSASSDLPIPRVQILGKSICNPAEFDQGMRAQRRWRVDSDLDQILAAADKSVPESLIPDASGGAENMRLSVLKVGVCSCAEIYSLWTSR